MKKFEIIILDAAHLDFEIAFNYYNEIRPTLADKFYNRTNTAFKDLIKNPFYQVRYDNFRMKIIQNFPYIIHFIINENEQTVIVYGIRNAYQDPKKYPSA